MTKEIKTFTKYSNIKPIEVIEPYNPEIIEFNSVEDFNVYYNTHVDEFNHMTTQKLNTKYKIPGYKITQKRNVSSDHNDCNTKELKLIKDYHVVARPLSIPSTATIDKNSNEYIKLLSKIEYLEQQIKHINDFLSSLC